MKETLDVINKNQIRFLDNELKIIDDSTFKKIRPGKEEESQLQKDQSKRSIKKPWQ